MWGRSNVTQGGWGIFENFALRNVLTALIFTTVDLDKATGRGSIKLLPTPLEHTQFSKSDAIM